MAVLANEKVLTLDYWKPAYKLQVGDYVFDRNGQIVQVKLVQQYRSSSCYEVIFHDHLRISGDDKLGFMLETKKYRIRACEYKKTRKFKRPLKHFDVSMLELLELRDKRNRHLFSVPTTNPLELPYQDLPVPPFLFGFWFFNHKTGDKMTGGDFVREKFKDHGYKILGSTEFTTHPSIRSQLAPNVPSKIPENYLLAAPEQRIELLRGILYAKSRQYSKSRDMFRFSCGHFGTIQQIQYLVESLGHRTYIEQRPSTNDYAIRFRSRLQLIEGQKSPPLKVHQSRRYITQINPLPEQMCVYIETTAPDNTILVGEGFIACR